jgi:hypothetical protein
MQYRSDEKREKSALAFSAGEMYFSAPQKVPKDPSLLAGVKSPP